MQSVSRQEAWEEWNKVPQSTDCLAAALGPERIAVRRLLLAAGAASA
ncbi:hypothetical protein SAMN05216553_101254 [Lentzea fradiae]|uniref:Uncharacterized protein n=1 Tax=Lentzea fradiae TaxID=200378 RepID=A0A1G7KGM1_9PSEU|nr:hypothetical protein SAMN05216553_101254 [Lentzea fradiae]